MSTAVGDRKTGHQEFVGGVGAGAGSAASVTVAAGAGLATSGAAFDKAKVPQYMLSAVYGSLEGNSFCQRVRRLAAAQLAKNGSLGQEGVAEDGLREQYNEAARLTQKAELQDGTQPTLQQAVDMADQIDCIGPNFLVVAAMRSKEMAQVRSLLDLGVNIKRTLFAAVCEQFDEAALYILETPALSAQLSFEGLAVKSAVSMKNEQVVVAMLKVPTLLEAILSDEALKKQLIAQSTTPAIHALLRAALKMPAEGAETSAVGAGSAGMGLI
jgi:hypothetical protein